MNKFIQYCRKNCKERVTKGEILTDTKKCNFCDVAYMIIEEEVG